ncbi:MAG: phage portal protein [Defluviitaleaceae bacterium]|nr:phage portal protein [Defluviitaleaceae bacterium]
MRDWLGNTIVGANIIRPFYDTILSDMDFGKEVIRNGIWYRGNCSELASFYGQMDDYVGNGSFWSQGGANPKIRKIHSGLPALIVDTLADLTVGDFLGVKVCSQGDGRTDWEDIADGNDFNKLLSKAVRQVLALGDGAFKISFDGEVSPHPIIEFFGGDRVRFNYRRGRVYEVVFLSDFEGQARNDKLVLEEIYSNKGIRYRLVNGKGEEVIGEKPADVEHNLGINLAVPLIFDDNPKFEGRGKSIFDSKIGAFDAIDEIISQWVDALRDGRVQKYIPAQMLPRNPHNGKLQAMNAFESRFVQTEMDLAEGADNSIKVVQPHIDTEAFEASYANFLNIALQGILSPSTLGIDLKRSDNAMAQREKEKATLYTRGKIIGGLRVALAQLTRVVMALNDALYANVPVDYEVQAEFGEYAAPSFDSQIESVGKGVQLGIISVETALEQLYGDTWTTQQKNDEIRRLCQKNGGN